METWKALLGLTVVLVAVTAVAELTDTSLSSPGGVLLLVGALFFIILLYATTRYGYRIGREVGETMSEEE